MTKREQVQNARWYREAKRVLAEYRAGLDKRMGQDEYQRWLVMQSGTLYALASVLLLEIQRMVGLDHDDETETRN